MSITVYDRVLKLWYGYNEIKFVYLTLWTVVDFLDLDLLICLYVTLLLSLYVVVYLRAPTKPANRNFILHSTTNIISSIFSSIYTNLRACAIVALKRVTDATTTRRIDGTCFIYNQLYMLCILSQIMIISQHRAYIYLLFEFSE